MRNLRKLTAAVLAIALVLTSMTATFAATAPVNGDKAVILKSLDLYAGQDANDPAIGLEDALTTQDSLIFLAKLFGYKDAADKLTADEVAEGLAKFDDADQISDYAKNVVAYSANNGILKGAPTGEELLAGAKDTVTAARFATFMLIQMGYTVPSYLDSAVQLSEVKGSKVSATETGDLTRDAAVGIMYGALTAEKASSKTVIDDIVGTDAAKLAIAVKEGLIVPVVTTLDVKNVTALNLKQVKVEFNQAVVKADAEKIGNYAVTEGTTNKADGGSVALQADEKSVIVTLGSAVSNGATVTVEVKNFATYKNDAVKFADNTVPTVVGVTVSGPNTLTVEYSEPMTFNTTSGAAITNGEFKVDGGNYIVSNLAIDGNKLTLTVGVNFTEGEHKVSFESKGEVKDYATYKVIPVTVDFTVVNNKTTPVVTVKSADPKQVVLAFDRPMNKTTVTTNSNAAFRHTYNVGTTFELLGNVGAAVSFNDAGTELTLDFTGKVIPLGANKIYIDYVSSTGDKITDLWGNKLEATSIDINITLDTVKPTVTEVTVENPNQLKVTFSEKVEVASAQTAGNYVVKDSAGKAVSIATAVAGSGDDANKVTLTTTTTNALGGGTYTIEIKGVKDQAFVNNIMDAYTTTLNFTDKVAPSVNTTASSIVVTADAVKASIYIPFSEVMDAATLVKANFMKDVGTGFVALGDNDTVTVAADGKSVTIVLDKATGLSVTSVKIKVGIVKDVAGNGLVTYTKDVSWTSGDAIAVKTVEATGTKQIKVTFDGRLSTVSATGFYLSNSTTATTGDIAMSIATHTVNADGLSEVVFNLGAALSENAQVNSAPSYIVVNGANDTKSYLGAVVTSGNMLIADKIVPTVSSAKFISATSIEVTFNEAINPATLAATLNGFTVSVGDAELTTVALTSPTVITLTGKNFVDGSTVVKYNSAAGITDLGGNKVADFEKTAAK